jgi:dynein heavy chain
MNTVLCQELVRFNRLISTIHTSLTQLQKALRGVSGKPADKGNCSNCINIPDRVQPTGSCYCFG